MFDYQGRLFTFGCSMTSYSYPTWADILGREFSYHENWARPGAGNNYIFNSIIECLQRNDIKDSDTLLIMWSGVARIDYYQFNEWSHLVNRHIDQISTGDEPVSCPNGYEIISYAYFDAIRKILDLKNINYQFLSFTGYDHKGRAGKLYKETLNTIKHVRFDSNTIALKHPAHYKLLDLYNRLAGSAWPALEEIHTYNKNEFSDIINQEVNEFIEIAEKNKHLYQEQTDVVDQHPTPIQHLDALKDNFNNVILSKDTITWVNDIDHRYKNGQDLNFKTNAPKERL